jgi:8-oxo-dGTP diphosphatase
MVDEPLQFGAAEIGVDYRHRPAAFGIGVRDGEIAMVKVTVEGQGTWFDLPGGGVDPGEDDAQAMVREFGEETGLKIRPGALVVRARQRFRQTDGSPVNNHSGHYLVEVIGEDPALKIEEDHELVWLAPQEALTRLRHDSHAWAVLSWLRALDRFASGD